MLMIAAALGEELKTAMELCGEQKNIPHRSVSLRQASRNSESILFLKTGVGPRRAMNNLEEALKAVPVTHILVIGYAGALDPGLKLGDLVAVRRAIAFSLSKEKPTWDNVQLEGAFTLVQGEALVRAAQSIRLRAGIGDVLTSSYVLGEPAHKKILYDGFGASIVDMETAALAGVAASHGVPISCIRVISDEAADSFLAPFSHDPSINIATRAGRLFDNGMVQTYRDWKSHTQIANRNLAQFLASYL
jgi:adenosylhomocysteine nucleosidase